ncbi:hypothetical protein BC834DRAFT_971338 [Gloeopeniophorella convolvens]|nr:hypothetical protein BC834DRAFT_971338 [Gloeopeniophorella convolvens]
MTSIALRALPADCYEIAFDETGWPLSGDEDTEYKRTERSQAAFEEWLRKCIFMKPPMDQLNPKHEGNYFDKSCTLPTLYFGFVASPDEIINCAKANGLLEDEVDEGWMVSWSLCVLKEHLEDICGIGVQIHYTDALTESYKYVIAMYTNYTVGGEKLVEEDEREVLDIIRDTLKLGSQLPKWWWNREEGLNQYIPPLPL